MMLGWQRTRGYYVLRTPVVGLEVRGAVSSRCFHVMLLIGRRGHMRFTQGLLFDGGGLVAYAAGTAGIRDAAIINNRRVMHDGFVHIGVANDGVVHPNDSRVIGELAPTPLAAHKTHSHVTEAIVDAAVISNVRSPVSGVQDVEAAFPAPIGRSPQRALIGGGNPGSGNPVVSIIAIGPVARRPHQP